MIYFNRPSFIVFLALCFSVQGSPMNDICSTSKTLDSLKESTSAEIPVELPIEQDNISQEAISQRVNHILDELIQAPRDDAKKTRLARGMEFLKMAKGYLILQTNNRKLVAKIRAAGAFQIMPRIFKQRVFYSIIATEEQRSDIDKHMTSLLAGYPEFQQTFEKIHAIAERSFPAGSLRPRPKDVKKIAKEFQWDFGVAFRESFREKFEEMKSKADFSPLDRWLGIIEQVHKSMDQLDETISEMKEFSGVKTW